MLLLAGIAPISALPVFLDALRTRRWESLEPWHTEGCAENVPNEECGFFSSGTERIGKMEKLLSEGAFSLRVVEERYSTLDARRLYWSCYLQGMRRLLPLSLRSHLGPLMTLRPGVPFLPRCRPRKKEVFMDLREGRVRMMLQE